jgi:hypothetical protein
MTRKPRDAKHLSGRTLTHVPDIAAKSALISECGDLGGQPCMRRQSKGFSLWPSPWREDDGGHAFSGISLPRSLYALVWRISAYDQIWLCVLSGLIAILNAVPIEIQRRVVDRSLKGGSFRSLTFFVLAYAGVVLLHGSLKLVSTFIGAGFPNMPPAACDPSSTD